MQPSGQEQDEASLAGRRVAVTGVAGFIGSHLAEALLAAGATVLGIDRSSPHRARRARDNLANCLAHEAFSFVEADLAGTAVRSLLTGVDTMFHLAAVPGVRDSWGERCADYARNNVLATQRITEACCSAGVRRLVVASSSSVYGDGARPPCREDQPPRPASPYGVTKLAAEQLCLAYAARPGSRTSVTALRYFTVYGPRQRPDMLISRALRAAHRGKVLQVFGDGSQARDFTYVADTVAATLAAATAPAQSHPVNVGGGRSTTVDEVLACVQQVTGRPVRVEYAAARPGDVAVTLADTARAAAVLGWRPRVPLAEGLARHHAWLEGLDRLPTTTGSIR
ncbi:NAD-dependent epimerase/dehydratase family protein [Kitasatospora griseola]